MRFLSIPLLLLMLHYAGYLLRMGWHFRRLAPGAGKPKEWPSVTVVVPARNEAAGIAACVRGILGQDYPGALALIVVDDGSEDGTAALALAAAEGDSRVHVIAAPPHEGLAYKKNAVAAAIAQAKGDWIVTTDADCVAGPGRLRAMGMHFAEADMVSGPVMLGGESLWERFQALEFMGLVAVGAGAIGTGRPTMCNGANLAYRRAKFAEVGGFGGIDHIASGDDELLMHKIASSGGRVRFAKDKAAVVVTPAQKDWASFKAQRVRWVSKSTHYKDPAITRTLVLSYLAILGIPLAGIWAALDGGMWWLPLALLGLKVGGEAYVLFAAAAFFGNLRLLALLLPEQVLHVAYVLWVGLAGNGKGYTWKGRSVK